MPKIKITEFDGTGSIQSGVISNTVFIPVTSTAASNGEAIAITSITELDAVENIDKSKLDYKIAKHLLNLGFDLVIQLVGNGSDGAVDWNALKDKMLFDIRFLTHGTQKWTQDMIACAKYRGDCIALINDDEASNYDYTTTTVREAFSGITDGEYAAAFTPWFTSRNSDFQETGATTPSDVMIPAAYGYLFAYANAIKNNPEWYAIAGFERGIIPELSSLCHLYTSADVEILQGRSAAAEVELDDENDNVGFAINPIANVRPAGPIIYGNRTLKVNDAAKKTIATSFLNVRNMVSAIKKVIYEAARKYTFEQNNELLWINFQSYITPLLDRMVSGNGLLGYRFSRLVTPAKARLKARLSIIPIEAVEDFEIEVYMTDDLTTLNE